MIQNLKEEIINSNNTKHLCHPIILEYLKNHNLYLKDAWIHVVYAIKTEPIIFSILYINKKIVIPEKSFKYYLLNSDLESFDELLYLVTLYSHCCFDKDSSWFLNKPNNPELINSYLSKSKGKMVFHYQLEQLYMSLTNSSIETAITFRKSINLKRKSAFDEAKSIILSNGKSLLNFIQESRIKDFTLYPKIKETMELFHFLNQNKW
jgi:hypothetical protein